MASRVKNKYISMMPLATVLILAVSPSSQGADDKKWVSLVNDANAQSQRLEQAQLQKARDAMNETHVREQAVLAKHQASGWQSKQMQKAQNEFNQRETREQKYLNEARDAAAAERKLPQSK